MKKWGIATEKAASAGFKGKVVWDKLSTDSDCKLSTSRVGTLGYYYTFTAKGTFSLTGVQEPLEPQKEHKEKLKAGKATEGVSPSSLVTENEDAQDSEASEEQAEDGVAALGASGFGDTPRSPKRAADGAVRGIEDGGKEDPVDEREEGHGKHCNAGCFL